MSAFDWPSLCRLGIGELRLKPEEFWRLTPAELQMMVNPVGVMPLKRSGLAALMDQFPDTLKEPGHG